MASYSCYNFQKLSWAYISLCVLADSTGKLGDVFSIQYERIAKPLASLEVDVRY